MKFPPLKTDRCPEDWTEQYSYRGHGKDLEWLVPMVFLKHHDEAGLYVLELGCSDGFGIPFMRVIDFHLPRHHGQLSIDIEVVQSLLSRAQTIIGEWHALIGNAGHFSTPTDERLYEATKRFLATHKTR